MPYTLSLDGLGRIRSVNIGLWSDETADRYVRDLQAKVGKIRGRGRPIMFLGDSTGSPVQTGSVTAKFLEAMTNLVASPNDRVGVVVASALVKLQVDRVFAATPQARAFTSMAEAEAWVS